MVRAWLTVSALAVLCGCDRNVARMEQPDDPQGPHREQIAAARVLLEQKEDWADRAEWEVEKSGDGWKVIAWRVEHSNQHGPNRYLPWGYSVIELDSRSVAVHY